MSDVPDRDLELERRLERERPLPDPSFRGELRRRLVTGRGPTPPRALMLTLAYGATGLVLMLIAALGVAGTGPFAA